MAKKKNPAQMHADDDVHRTIRYSPDVEKLVDKVVYQAGQKKLRVLGRKAPVKVRASHVLRLAVELGLPLVLDRIEALQGELPGGEE